LRLSKYGVLRNYDFPKTASAWMVGTGLGWLVWDVEGDAGEVLGAWAGEAVGMRVKSRGEVARVG
jgi:hypothetical protein